MMLTVPELKQVPASLVLGGFDANRLYAHNATFSLDPSQNPVVSLNQLNVSSTSLPAQINSPKWKDGSLVLLEPADAHLYTIDSSTPFLWLPESICANFEEAFGLEYNDALQLYLLNATQQQLLESANLTFNFQLSDLPGSSNTVEIDISYGAFDLSLSYGYSGLNTVFPNMTSSSTPVPYFPLRKAANSSQYTIGRAFLQETYLIVDYERNNFSISRARFSENAIQNQAIVNIDSPSLNSTALPNHTTGGLTLGVWIGIGIGALVIVVLATLLLFYCIVIKPRKHREAVSRLGSNEGGGLGNAAEVGTEDLKEMPTDMPKPAELPAVVNPCQELPATGFKFVTLPAGHDPGKPVELAAEEPNPNREYIISQYYSPVSEPSIHASDTTSLSAPMFSPLTPEHGGLDFPFRGRLRSPEQTIAEGHGEYFTYSSGGTQSPPSRESQSRQVSPVRREPPSPQNRPFSWDEHR
jgi:hypothetical protein